jgi:hypothetical protein
VSIFCKYWIMNVCKQALCFGQESQVFKQHLTFTLTIILCSHHPEVYCVTFSVSTHFQNGQSVELAPMQTCPVTVETYQHQRWSPLRGWMAPFFATDRYEWTDSIGSEQRLVNCVLNHDTFSCGALLIHETVLITFLLLRPFLLLQFLELVRALFYPDWRGSGHLNGKSICLEMLMRKVSQRFMCLHAVRCLNLIMLIQVWLIRLALQQRFCVIG